MIFGTAHSCVGQEAIAVGAAGVMRETDYLVGHHRSHGHLIAAGADLQPDDGRDVRQADGLLQGARRLDAHRRPLARHPRLQRDRRRRASPTPAARRSPRRCAGPTRRRVAFFGDGAAGQGAAHEGMNLAATWKLPVVFICENNQFALSADWRTQRAVEDLAERAAGYGMPGEVVDGNDVLAVEDAVGAALDRARAGGGPTFLEMKTFRRMQHSMRANLPDVRDPALVEEWEAEGSAAAVRAAAPRAGRARRRPRGRDPRRGRARGRVGGRRRRSPTRTRAPTTSCPPCSPRSAATRRPPPRRSATLGSSRAIREALELELDADPT